MKIAKVLYLKYLHHKSFDLYEQHLSLKCSAWKGFFLHLESLKVSKTLLKPKQFLKNSCTHACAKGVNVCAYD